MYLINKYCGCQWMTTAFQASIQEFDSPHPLWLLAPTGTPLSRLDGRDRPTKNDQKFYVRKKENYTLFN